MRILLSMVFSEPMPLTLYLVFRFISMGLPALVTSWLNRSISEKAVCKPYHCGSYCSRPLAMVRGSWKTPSSVQSLSFARLGLPAKRSRTDPTTVLVCSRSSTPGAVLMSVASMLSWPLSPTVDILAIGALRSCVRDVDLKL